MKSRCFGFVLAAVIRLVECWALNTGIPAPCRTESVNALDGVMQEGGRRSTKVVLGEVAVIKNWLPEELCHRLRKDAAGLFDAGLFRADGLASYVAERKFDDSQDRMTMQSSAWVDQTVGDTSARETMSQLMKTLRLELAHSLRRPTLAEEMPLSHEITYSRYAPGAALGRHTDEHHEESKGREGWLKPTRRSVSWLVYLNDDWRPHNAGALRCYELSRPVAGDVETVGADEDGAVQVGWLDSPGYSTRPVFMESERQDTDGNCALFIPVANQKKVISRSFFVPREPINFAQFITDPEEASMFRRLVTPRNAKDSTSASSSSTDWLDSNNGMFKAVDIAPEAGTLVLFDSVALLHEVLAPVGRDRWAATGWFHEQLPVP